MRVVITCGPSFEPIDEVRRITNFSSGELGALLARRCEHLGFETLCLMGEAATWPRPAASRPFSTNADLLAQLRAIERPEEVDLVLHAAALADFQVAAVRDSGGCTLTGSKIPSRAGALTIELEPAVKLIGELRGIFPRAWIAGWKYELEGSRAEGLRKALLQIRENRTNACFLNGKAYGPGFGLVSGAGEQVRHFEDKAALCAGLFFQSGGAAFGLPAADPFE